jgi:wyosine [tRNA(Phe)-imidazoG37] synthetase (radical SAM superfamily)
MPYEHLFGPVPSRRLGRSLGVDIVPAKVCNLNCVYCECGQTTKLTDECREWVPPQAITEELSDFLGRSPVLDVVTITGSGEPTLNTGLQAIVSFVKEKFPNYKTALLTNGTLLHLDDVRRAATLFDFVLPSLDAVSAEGFAKVNRPHRALDNGRIIAGIAQFAREYKGRLWLEVFIVPGVNDTPEELSLLKEAILAMAPGRVQLNTLDRPGASASVRPATDRELCAVADFLRPAPVEIISRSYAPATGAVSDASFESSVLSMLRRRPCTVEDIAVATGRTINDAAALLSLLEKRGEVTIEAVANRNFYRTTRN